MLLLVRNNELIKDREKTYLTAAVTAGDTSLTVNAVDTNAWADNDYVIVGEIGTGNAEILRISAAVSDGTILTVTQSGTDPDSAGARFNHSIGEPVYRIDYNRIEFSHSATDDAGASSVLATNEIQPDDVETRFEDTSNTTGFGFVRFNNQHTSAFSAYSDGIPYTGYAARSLGRMMRAVRRQLGLKSTEDIDYIEDEDIIEEINEKQRDVAHERLWPFYEIIRSDSIVANQREYTVDDNVVIAKAHTVIVDSAPMAKIGALRQDILNWDVNITGDPTHVHIWNNRMTFYPLPVTAATANALNGAITAAVTTITLDSASGFRAPGRALIESEIISYEIVSSTQLLGVQRGLEGTTAATHADDIAITERDIIYTAHEEPTELRDPGDLTSIPDPLVLVYGASMELAIGKLKDQPMHDRIKAKYDQALERLRDKFGKKITSANFRIKDKSEVVSDIGRFVDPNRFPRDITAA